MTTNSHLIIQSQCIAYQNLNNSCHLYFSLDASFRDNKSNAIPKMNAEFREGFPYDRELFVRVWQRRKRREMSQSSFYRVVSHSKSNSYLLLPYQGGILMNYYIAINNIKNNLLTLRHLKFIKGYPKCILQNPEFLRNYWYMKEKNVTFSRFILRHLSTIYLNQIIKCKMLLLLEKLCDIKNRDGELIINKSKRPQPCHDACNSRSNIKTIRSKGENIFQIDEQAYLCFNF